MAVVTSETGSIDVRVRDVSPYGALLDAKVPPPPTGSTVTFIRDDVTVRATVAWVAQRRFGLEFEQQVAPEEVLVTVHSGAPQPPPPVSDFKRPGFNNKLSMEEMWLAAHWLESSPRDRPGE